MLTERELELIQEKIVRQFTLINDEMLEVIGLRIKEVGQMKTSDAYKIKRMLESGADVNDIKRKLAQATESALQDMETALERVAKENYDFAETFYKAKSLQYLPFKDNTAVQKIWIALYQQSSKELINLTRNTAFMTFDENNKKIATTLQKGYNDIIDKAVMQASSDLIDYQSAIRSTIKQVADSGIRSVDYATGYNRRLDTAVRQNVLWALKECNQRVAEMTGEDFGADGFEVSYHSNPRPSHVTIGGRTFSYKGDKRIAGKFYPDGKIAKELLSDYGCLHFAFPVVLGVSEPTIPGEELTRLKAEDARKIKFEDEEMTKYEASQKQRQIETKIRHLKDRANIAKASGDDELRRETQTKINLLTSKYAKLSKSADLPTKMERMSVRGFRAVKPAKQLTNANGDVILPVKKSEIKGIPNSITQFVGGKGGIERNYYGDDGRQYKQVSNNNHNKPKHHPFGKNGEHAHDYIYDKEGNLTRYVREISETERKENADIL